MENDQKISKNVEKLFFYVYCPHNPCEVIGSPLGWLTRLKRPTWSIFFSSKLVTSKFGSLLGWLTSFQNPCKLDTSPLYIEKKTMQNDQKISKNVEKLFFYVKSPHNPCEVIGSPLEGMRGPCPTFLQKCSILAHHIFTRYISLC